MVFVCIHKSLHGHVDCPDDDLGLSTVVYGTRRNGVALLRRAATNAAAPTFSIRALTSWNKLLMTVVQPANLFFFRQRLKAHYFALC